MKDQGSAHVHHQTTHLQLEIGFRGIRWHIERDRPISCYRRLVGAQSVDGVGVVYPFVDELNDRHLPRWVVGQRTLLVIHNLEL